jgi:hypothetical protein
MSSMEIVSFVPSLPTWLVSPVIATAACWFCAGACVDTPLAPAPPQARLVASWDPLACGEPHRVVVELEDDAGVPLAASTPCALGELVIDAPHFGIYRGRIYAYALGEPIRSIVAVELTIDEPVVQWVVQTPR